MEEPDGQVRAHRRNGDLEGAYYVVKTRRDGKAEQIWNDGTSH